jgi:hypothetical protein
MPRIQSGGVDANDSMKRHRCEGSDEDESTPRLQPGGIDAKDLIRASITRNINSSEPIKKHRRPMDQSGGRDTTKQSGCRKIPRNNQEEEMREPYQRAGRPGTNLEADMM